MTRLVRFVAHLKVDVLKRGGEVAAGSSDVSAGGGYDSGGGGTHLHSAAQLITSATCSDRSTFISRAQDPSPV